MRDRVDCVVVGAGAVGLAVARALALDCRDVLVIERAATIGTGTSSRNSEVIHAGIYYPTQSLKARLCVAGKALLYSYLEQKQVDNQRLGKLIVAVSDDEVHMLETYCTQAAANGVHDLQWLSADEARRLEPQVQCTRAVLSPSSGILDTHGYMLALQADIESARGQLAFRTPVKRVEPGNGGLRVFCGGDSAIAVDCDVLVNAAGLHAPALAAKTVGLDPDHVPDAYFAKGHYYTLRGRSPFTRLVYPVADAESLGIHVTLDLAGAARFGPDVQWVDGEDYVFDESRRSAFTAAIRRYYPDLDEGRLQPGYTGVRPKLVGPGESPADFRVDGPMHHGVDGLVNLFGIESPGITASLAIAEHVRQLLDN
jgi:L-2-hydroxyglutarate oxidase LhgO